MGEDISDMGYESVFIAGVNSIIRYGIEVRLHTVSRVTGSLSSEIAKHSRKFVY